MSPTRRDFLRLAGAVGAGAMLLPQASLHALGRAAAADRRLVLVFLEGGNDGLNTVVPVGDDAYYAARKDLALRGKSLHRVDEYFSLHPSLDAWRGLFADGVLSVLHAVGYDRPDYSHFLSRDIWHSGRRDTSQPKAGWLGTAAARRGGSGLPPVGLGVTEAPLLLKTPLTTGLTVGDLSSFYVDTLPQLPQEMGKSGPLAMIHQASALAYETSERLREVATRVPEGKDYPDSGLADRLKLIARLARAEGGPPVMWTRLGGFDTHALQPGAHAALLKQVGDATAAFHRDLASDGTDRRTLMLIYSEFGRRVAENGSAGTDHGAAGPMFAIGGGIRGGFIGKAPSLTDLDQGNLKAGLDFRAVFSECLRDWMGWSAVRLFDGPFADGQAGVGLLKE
jgi:uncharacterized protein (DUF1501 family)